MPYKAKWRNRDGSIRRTRSEVLKNRFEAPVTITNRIHFREGVDRI